MLYEEQDQEAHDRQCDTDARLITTQYGLPCPVMFAAAIRGMYRNPLHRKGAEFEDGIALDPHTLERFRTAYAAIHNQAVELRWLLDTYMRRGLPFVIDTLDPRVCADANSALFQLSELRPLPVVRDSAAAFLPKHVADLGAYLLFVLDEGPVLFDSQGTPTAHRQLIADTLSLTGWSYEDSQIDQHCRALQVRLHNRRGSSCGFRRNSQQREKAAR